MKKLIAIVCLFAASFGLIAAESTTPPATPPAAPVRPEIAKLGLGGLFHYRVDVSKLPADLQALIKQFQTSRESLIASRNALFESMKTLTAEQKRAAVQAWTKANTENFVAQRGLAKQIRESLKAMRKERQRTAPGG